MQPNRDLNRAIRVILGLIRELGVRRLLLSRPALGVAGATPENRTAHFFPKEALRRLARNFDEIPEAIEAGATEPSHPELLR